MLATKLDLLPAYAFKITNGCLRHQYFIGYKMTLGDLKGHLVTHNLSKSRNLFKYRLLANYW